MYCIAWNVLQNLNFVFAISAILPSNLIKINISRGILIPLSRQCFHWYIGKKENFPVQKVRTACKKFPYESLWQDSPICQYPKYCLNKWTTIVVMCVNYPVVSLFPKDKIPSNSKRNLKTSQPMNQIYKRRSLIKNKSFVSYWFCQWSRWTIPSKKNLQW